MENQNTFPHRLLQVRTTSIFHRFLTQLQYLVANATLFYLLFPRKVLRRVHFTFSNFAWGLHGDVDVQ